MDVEIPLFGENLGYIQLSYLYEQEARKGGLASCPHLYCLNDFSLFKLWLEGMKVGKGGRGRERGLLKYFYFLILIFCS